VNVTVVGGGLAGSEAAWALAQRGVGVTLCEMRPVVKTPAHQTDRLAELVCSNSFKSVDLTNAHGLLKAELRALGSLLLPCADQARVPGGAALAVDREIFSRAVHAQITAHPGIAVLREEATGLPSPGVVATGPLTSERLAGAIATRLGATALAFYDAIAPVVADDSLTAEQAWELVQNDPNNKYVSSLSKRERVRYHLALAGMPDANNPGPRPVGGCIATATSSLSASGLRNTRSSSARSCRRPPLARTSVLSALAMRPWRPITLPMSSSATCSLRTTAPSRSVRSTRTSSGLSTRFRARYSSISSTRGPGPS